MNGSFRTLLLLPALFVGVVSVASAQEADSVLAVSRAGVSLFRVNVDGNVGVGTSSPTSKLTVNGGIRADSALVGKVRFTDGTMISTTAVEVVGAALLNGMTDCVWGDHPVGYYKDVSRRVYLEGRVRVTANPVFQPLFYLPIGFRPRNKRVFRLWGNDVYGIPIELEVNSSDGRVRFTNVPHLECIDISAVSFLAQQ